MEEERRTLGAPCCGVRVSAQVFEVGLLGCHSWFKLVVLLLVSVF